MKMKAKSGGDLLGGLLQIGLRMFVIYVVLIFASNISFNNGSIKDAYLWVMAAYGFPVLYFFTRGIEFRLRNESPQGLSGKAPVAELSFMLVVIIYFLHGLISIIVDHQLVLEVALTASFTAVILLTSFFLPLRRVFR